MKLDLATRCSGRSGLPIEGVLDLDLAHGRPVRAEIHGSLCVDNMESRISVSGNLSAKGPGECARCLVEFDQIWEVPVEIMVLRKVDSEEGPADTLVLHQTSGVVDLSESLRECVILAYPQVPVCKEGCQGICVQCGADLNESTCGCVVEEVDSRWDGLP